jgi:DHA3 family macrolide efflux protein-like MFS transporter
MRDESTPDAATSSESGAQIDTNTGVEADALMSLAIVDGSGAGWTTRFFTIWIGQALSLIGSGLTQFALAWWLTIESGSATVLAIATLFALLPQVLLSPFAGVLADRWNRRLILIVADSVIALATVVLLALWMTGVMQIWHVYVIMFVRSAGSAFHSPTMSASTSQLVPKEYLGRVAGLNQMLQGITMVLSPALGALLLSYTNLGIVMAVDIVTAAFAIIPLFFFAIPQPAVDPVQADTPVTRWVLNDLREGLRYVGARRGLVYALMISTSLNFLITPAFSLMPLYINKVFSGTAQSLAWVEIAIGVGTITGGIALAAWGGFKNKVITGLMGIFFLGAGAAVIGLAPVAQFGVLIVGGLIFGGAISFSNGPIFAVLQTIVAPEMQARVFSLLMTAALAITPISLLVAGPLADAFGIRLWYLLAASICFILAVVGYFLPDLRDMETRLAPPPAALPVGAFAGASAQPALEILEP